MLSEDPYFTKCQGEATSWKAVERGILNNPLISLD